MRPQFVMLALPWAMCKHFLYTEKSTKLPATMNSSTQPITCQFDNKSSQMNSITNWIMTMDAYSSDVTQTILIGGAPKILRHMPLMARVPLDRHPWSMETDFIIVNHAKKRELHSGSTLNSRRASSPLVRLMEREERWDAPHHLQGILFQSWVESEPNRSVACMVLQATANDRHAIKPFAMMNFVGLDLARADQILRNQYQKQAPLAVITERIRLGIESNTDYMSCTGTDDYSASTRYHSSSTRCFLLVKDLVNVEARTTVEHFPYQGKSIQYWKHAAVHYPA
ncbi:hypothetical protein TNCV_142661 [Trichonephila clavipes]|nr:hypothetical protein TNCV_142661 [Trichonephila clavipes]